MQLSGSESDFFLAFQSHGGSWPTRTGATKGKGDQFRFPNINEFLNGPWPQLECMVAGYKASFTPAHHADKSITLSIAHGRFVAPMTITCAPSLVPIPSHSAMNSAFMLCSGKVSGFGIQRSWYRCFTDAIGAEDCDMMGWDGLRGFPRFGPRCPSET